MSSTRKAYLYRLYPTEEQAHALQHQLDVARELYNACLLERREAYGMARLTLNYYDQANQLKEVWQLPPTLRPSTLVCSRRSVGVTTTPPRPSFVVCRRRTWSAGECVA
jgi:hypothetical protein